MVENILIKNDIIVVEFRHSLREGTVGLKHVPGLLKRILRDECWRKRVIQQTGEIAEFDSFEEFVTAHPLEGLGADLILIRNIIRDDPEALDLFDQAVVKGDGRPPGGMTNDLKTHNNVMSFQSQSSVLQGNTKQYALRRLRRERPDLHQAVLAQELSAHAAMIKAGFRERRITIPVDPERAARGIKRHFQPEQIVKLVQHLTDK